MPIAPPSPMSLAARGRPCCRPIPNHRSIEMSNPDGPTHITHVRTVGIPVSDQDRALDFWVGALGFEKRSDYRYGEGQRWVEVAPPGASTSIALVPARDGYPAGVDTGIRLTTTDAAADHAALKGAGVAVRDE